MGFLRHAKPASWGGENGSRRGKTDPEGSKVGDLLYTGMVPDAKTEIPVNIDEVILGVKAIDKDGNESLVSAFVTPPYKQRKVETY